MRPETVRQSPSTARVQGFLKPPPLPLWIERELPFRRRMARIDGVNLHFIDEGTGRPVILLHGNPTWSYLWRKVIPEVTRRGMRAIVPDLWGFGLSDKPRHPSEHRIERHLALIAGLLEALDVSDMIVVGQDWGGPIGMGVARQLESRLHGLVLANTAVIKPRRPLRPKPFHRFSHLPGVSDAAFRGLLFPIPLLDRAQGDRHSIGWREKRAYAWPLRRPWDRAGPLGLARMVPNHESHPALATLDLVGAWVESFHGPCGLVWGERDPILGRGLARHRQALPQATVRRSTAGHFLQEEVAPLLGEAIGEVDGASPHRH